MTVRLIWVGLYVCAICTTVFAGRVQIDPPAPSPVHASVVAREPMVVKSAAIALSDVKTSSVLAEPEKEVIALPDIGNDPVLAEPAKEVVALQDVKTSSVLAEPAKEVVALPDVGSNPVLDEQVKTVRGRFEMLAGVRRIDCGDGVPVRQGIVSAPSAIVYAADRTGFPSVDTQPELTDVRPVLVVADMCGVISSLATPRDSVAVWAISGYDEVGITVRKVHCAVPALYRRADYVAVGIPRYTLTWDDLAVAIAGRFSPDWNSPFWWRVNFILDNVTGSPASEPAMADKWESLWSEISEVNAARERRELRRESLARRYKETTRGRGTP